MTQFKVWLDVWTPLKKNQIPLSHQELKLLFKWLNQQTQKLEEYQNMISVMKGAPTGVAVVFCDDLKMRQTHKNFRRLDKTTDILSFPTTEIWGADLDLDSRLVGERSAGDLLVSIPTLERHAKKYRKTLRDETLQVLIHGWLHLLGMDHVRGGLAARRMKSLQVALFKKAKKDNVTLHGQTFRKKQSGAKSKRSASSI